MQIFELGLVDMDDTLCDFVSQCLKVHNKSDMHYPRGVDVHQALEFGEAEKDHDDFWKPIHEAGEGFWAEMIVHSWCMELLHATRVICKEVKICSSPGRRRVPSVFTGKIRWLNRQAIYDEFLPIKSKHLLAAPGRLLIDDSEKNVEQFRAAGGMAILFPSISNSLHEHVISPMFYFGMKVHELILDAKGKSL